jgi:uncharacterized protein (TIGR00297 family)
VPSEGGARAAGVTDTAAGVRTLEGAVAAAAIAALAWQAGSLAPSGAIAATIVGTAAIAAGWRWGALLIAYFVVASALSRLGGAAKAARTGTVVAKGGPRDATQVAANGGAFAAAAVVSIVWGPPTLWAGVGISALAASSADTWGTEVGTLAGGTPRMLVGWRPVPPGTSGGVTVAGSVATVGGALFVAALARALGWPAAVTIAALVAGVTGALVDSLLGATLQQRRWCERCNVATERAEHGCGAATVYRGGLRWLDNDRVNLLASFAGAAVGGVLTWLAVRPSGA